MNSIVLCSETFVKIDRTSYEGVHLSFMSFILLLKSNVSFNEDFVIDLRISSNFGAIRLTSLWRAVRSNILRRAEGVSSKWPELL